MLKYVSLKLAARISKINATHKIFHRCAWLKLLSFIKGKRLKIAQQMSLNNSGRLTWINLHTKTENHRSLERTSGPNSNSTTCFLFIPGKLLFLSLLPRRPLPSERPQLRILINSQGASKSSVSYGFHPEQ